jgi:CrcB protein
MTKLLLIACAGGAGTLLRFLAAGWGQRLTTTTFPLGTLMVNITGCLLIGLFGGLFAGPALVREELRLALMVGFLGGFTTFSTFGFETFGLLADGDWSLALANVVVSNVAGVVAVWLGYRIALAWQGG